MRQSLAVAMEIQQQLLPHAPPALPGLEIAGKAIYCDETGGDYYDFMELVSLGPSRVGIAVGDVTGHGIGAALLMASARGVLRSHAAQEGADLGKILGTVNAHLVRDAAPDRFMTLFYGLLDAEMRTLTYVSAGHDPALWLHGATKAIEELDNAGLPLGVLAEEDYRQAEPTHLKSGDVIVIGTDGIWEARNAADKMFGKARLREILVEQAERSAEEIHKAVVEAVYAFMETRPQEDDITLVVVKAL